MVGAVALLAGCETSTVEPEAARFGYNYYPLAVGQYRVYDVFRIDYRPIGFDTSRFQLREVITDTLTDLTGGTSYRLERYTRPDASAPWPTQPDSVWTTRRSQTQAVRTDNNVPYVRLSFPLANRRVWDVNVLNTRAEQPAVADQLGQPYALGDSTYEETVRVVYDGRVEGTRVIDTDSNFVSFRRHVVRYAADIGLVEIDIRREEYDTQVLGDPRPIASGLRYHQRLIEHGE